VALLAMLLFTAATPFAEILRLFQRMKMPGLLVTTLALMHRYLYVLADEAGRMRRARQSRTFAARRHLRWHTLSTIIAQLFLRASDRADRIYDAMRARGWGEEQ
jgi:cobalt/nickel transport system permease protein